MRNYSFITRAIAILAFVISNISTSGANCNDSDRCSDNYTKNIYRTVYAEVLGPSHLIGISYDSRFRNECKFGYRLGFGYTSSWEDIFYVTNTNAHSFNIPLEVNGIFGSKKNYFETGVGISPMFTYERCKFTTVDYGSDGSKNYGQLNISDTSWGLQTYLNAGYRYQRPRGLQVRVGLTAGYVVDKLWSYWELRPYLSFGYTFK